MATKPKKIYHQTEHYGSISVGSLDELNLYILDKIDLANGPICEINISSYTQGWDSETYMSIRQERDETPEELKKRQDKAKKEAERRKKKEALFQEKQILEEKKLLEELKKKYESH